MKKELFLLFFFALFSFGQLLAQTDRSLQEFYTDYYMEKVKFHATPLTYADITGSPYLDEEFSEGVIFMKNQKKYTVLLRFNLYESNFEFKADTNIIVIDNPNNILKIELDGCTYVYYKLTNRSSFIESIVSDKYSLIGKKEVVLKNPEPAEAYKEPKPASFLRKNDEFYIVNEENDQFFVKSKKSLLSIFEDKREQIQKFIKKEKISHKKKTDLKRLVEYYNSL